MLALIAKAGLHSKLRSTAQDQFARSLSRHGAIPAQNVLCEAVSSLGSDCGLGEDRLRALLEPGS
jgi:hypothetical protein